MNLKLLLAAAILAWAPPAWGSPAGARNASLAASRVGGAALKVQLLSGKRRARRFSCGKATLTGFTLHSRLPLLIMRCEQLGRGCSRRPGEMGLCSPFAAVDSAVTTARLIDARTGRGMSVPKGFSFSPVAGHAFFYRGEREPLRFVAADNLQRYVNSRGRKGARKLPLSLAKVEAGSLASRCPSRQDRGWRLSGASWLPGDVLRIGVYYCLRYFRLVDFCAESSQVRLASAWNRSRDMPVSDGPPSACGQGGDKVKGASPAPPGRRGQGAKDRTVILPGGRRALNR